jgi:hypothetical protein
MEVGSLPGVGRNVAQPCLSKRIGHAPTPRQPVATSTLLSIWSELGYRSMRHGRTWRFHCSMAARRCRWINRHRDGHREPSCLGGHPDSCCVLLQPKIEIEQEMNASPSIGMPQIQTRSTAENAPSDCICRTILDFMLPFFLAGAGGVVEVAHAAILELLDAYAPATMQELDLASRVIIFGITSMDNLRLSMSDPLMPDTVKLRYRSNAVALSRSAEQCRAILREMQANGCRTASDVGPFAMVRPHLAQSAATGLPASISYQLGSRPVPEAAAAPPKAEPAAPTIVPAQPPAQAELPTPPLAQPRVSAGDATDKAEFSASEIEQMKRDARVMIHALHARGGPMSILDDRSASDPCATDPFAAARAAADAAFAAGASQRTRSAGTSTSR